MQFAEFIAPLDGPVFLRQYFGRQPIHIPRGLAPPLDILDWRRFNNALAIASYWNEDTLKVYYRSRAALRENYCDTGEARGRSAPVNPAKLKALTAVGATIVANHIHRVSPSVANVVHALEREFAARVFANVYCSFREVQAFQTHFDLHDVFAYQAEGEKLWRVYEARADTPISPVPPGDEAEKWLIQSRGKLLFEALMKPGDVLYLPRGQYHDAITGADASLHVTFGVAPANGLALLKVLEAALAQEGAFRAYLPDARDPQALSARLGSLAERVKAVMTSEAFAIDVLNLQRGLATPVVEYSLPAQPATDWFCMSRPAQVKRRDSGFSLVHQHGEIALGAVYPTIEWILRQGKFSYQEAATRQVGLDAAELRRALESLLASGVIAPVEFT
jgi:bifunctional lysine-specific demethylase and histidyl-hydroxylase NO66